jgi:ABC-type proline/glycine betaine transport system ATPase subunit
MQAQLESLVTEFNQTVVFITHSIDEAIALGDRIAVISHRPGTVREVIEVGIERPRLAEGEITQHPGTPSFVSTCGTSSRTRPWEPTRHDQVRPISRRGLQCRGNQQRVNTPGGGGL